MTYYLGKVLPLDLAKPSTVSPKPSSEPTFALPPYRGQSFRPSLRVTQAGGIDLGEWGMWSDAPERGVQKHHN
jgi:hypothetical protein